LRRNRCPWYRHALAAACVLLNAPAGGGAGEPPPGAPETPRAGAGGTEVPVNVFLSEPSDPADLWKTLARPDFVILRGDQYARLRDRDRQGSSSVPGPWAHSVVSVAVEGGVAGDLADLTVTFGVSLAADGPVWVPIRLDGATLAGAREGDRDLPLRAVEGGGWQVELSGKRSHSVRAALLVPVRAGPDGRRLELAIPEAGSTRVAVVVPRRAVEARSAAGEPLRCEPVRPGEATRISADLTPRSKLTLTWRVDEEADAHLLPLLSAQGEIAVEVDAGAFRTRSSWSIRSARGSARSLQIRLDAADELIDLELDGQRTPAGTERVNGDARLTVTLNEPISPGRERRLVMTTRRPVPAGKAARVAFRGFPLVNVREQAGAIGVATAGNLWVTGAAGRGLRQIDPRTELPADLRARPATELAYQFSEQPFELDLRVEVSPPLVRAADRTTVVIDPRSARVETWLDVETARGRLYDLALELPAGLEVESVGPAGVVASTHSDVVPSAFLPGATGGLRLVTVRLGPKAQESGRFSIHLVGRQDIDATGHAVPVALFRPIGVVSAGGRVAVLTGPSLTADLADEGSGAGAFRPAAQSPPADWPWPGGRAPATPPMLWLRHDDSPALLPLRVTSHPRTLSHATALRVRVDRREAVVEQETECSARFGSFDHLDVTVPADLAGRWEVQGAAVSQQAEIGRTPGGDRRVRLKLGTELTRSVRLRFRFRLPFVPALTPEAPAVFTVPWVRLDEPGEASSPPRASVAAEPGLAAEARGGSWVPSGDPDEVADGAASRLARVGGPDALALTVTVRSRAELPGVVASRLALRTVETLEGDLRTTARYWVELHDSSLSFGLPPGADLLLVRVGGEVVRGVERLAGGAGYRVAFPARVGEAPAAVEVSYSVPAARASAVWRPPVLLDGGVVQQALWEVCVPWSLAVVGVPPGWTDENDWYWDSYVWKRRPWKTSAGLAAWAGGPTARALAPAEPGPEPDPRGAYHSYLFGRPGGPTGLPLRVAARAWIVAACSGSVLAVGGLLILVWHPPPRPAWVAGVVLGLSVATLLHPSETFLAVQSGMVGVLLTVLLAVMHRVLGRRPAGSGAYGDPGHRVTGFGGVGSTLSRVGTVGVGSDDSTAIRGRPLAPSATAEHVPHLPPSPPVGDGSDSRPGRPPRGGVGA